MEKKWGDTPSATLILLLMCVSSVGFAWGVLRGVLGEYAVL